MFDLTKVRAADGNQAAGFEELCIHLAEAMCHEPLRQRQRVHGAGGDGGVETIVTTESGRLVGIQCKYFRENLAASQWAQIKESVGQAMTKHPDLSDYIVCVPRDRTPGQLKTWETLVSDWKSRYPRLVITWFGRSELNDLLIQPKWRYLAVYWLKAPDYSTNWLAQKLDQAILQLHRRFIPRFHNKTQAQKSLAIWLALPEALGEHEDLCRDLAINARDLARMLSRGREHETNALTVASVNLEAAVSNMLSGIAEGRLLAQDAEFASTLPTIDQTAGRLVKTVREQENLLREVGREAAGRAMEPLSRIVRLARDVQVSSRRVHQVLLAHQKALRSPLWLLIGEAGIGKSHLMATVAQRVLKQDAGAVLLLGEQFLEVRPPIQQIPDLLNWEHSFFDLLACLRTQSETSGRPSLILIDAINESPERNLWLSHLAQLVHAIEAYPGVHLLLSCREDWLSACVPPHLVDTAPTITHRGYDLDFEAAVNAYFEGYNVSADVFPSFTPEFRNPLFLKTVCETYEDRKLPREPLSFVAVIDEWENRICEKIEQAIDCRRNFAKNAIELIVQQLAAQHAASIPAGVAEGICLGVFPTRTASGSLYKSLQSFGVIEETVRDGFTFVRLQYERFYDIKVVRSELRKFENAAEWSRFWCKEIVPHLDDRDVAVASQARLFAYALLLPEIFNLEIVEWPFPEPDETGYSPGNKVWDTWLEALAWRKIPAEHDRVRRLFTKWEKTGEPPIEVFKRLMSFAAIQGHPLNADFLHDLLWSKTLAKRELLWTIQIGYADLLDEQDELGSFIHWCEVAGRRCSDEQARLASTVLLWLTSTTNQKNRDRATDSAILLLQGRPAPTFRMVERFWEVDDPYVKERLLAVVAGVVPTFTRSDLRTLGNCVCTRFFGGSQVSPNLLQREYARFIAEYCIHQGVLSDALLQHVRPPYRTVMPVIWPDTQLRALEDDPAFNIIIRSLQPEGNGRMYGDFGRYVMQKAVQNFTKPATVNAAAERLSERYPREDAQVAKRYILQRVVELGWADEKDEFDRFERSIRSDGRQRSKMERISKKFQWISLYEYLGFLSDHSKLRRPSNELVDLSSASELWLRDYDPALVFFPKTQKRSALLSRMEASYNPIPQMDGGAARTAWMASDFENFTQYLYVDIEGEPRLVLSSHLSFDELLPFGVTKESVQHAAQWVNLYSFIVPEENTIGLCTQLQNGTLWGRGVELPTAYSGWMTEYPWHPMLDEVESECSSDNRLLTETNGLFHGTVCSVGTEELPFSLPSPGICREMSKSSLGVLSAPERNATGDFSISAQNRQKVFWGSIGGSPIVAASYQEFMGWLRDRKWNLIWYVLSERSIHQDTELLSDSNQSAVIVLRPFEKPLQILMQRDDWKRDEEKD